MRSRLGLILSIAVLVVGATGAVAVATGGGGGGHHPPAPSVKTFEFVGYGPFGECTLLKLKAPLLALLGIKTKFPAGKDYCFKTVTF